DRLISDISDASRLDAELAREDATPVDLPTLLSTVVGVSQEVARERNVAIVLDIARSSDRQAYVVPGHGSRLGQVIHNLIDNALSCSPPGGTITVSARRVDGEVEVVVEDEGPGIRPEVLGRIFERFYTDRPEGEAFGNNSGLGLSISRQIVEAHGGRIWAENRSDPKPGKGGRGAGQGEARTGARFVVRLPAE